MNKTHDLVVRLLNGDTLVVPTERPRQTAVEVARALAERLKGAAVMWGESAIIVGIEGAPDEPCGPVVIPAQAIACVEVLDLEPAPEPAVADGATTDDAHTADPVAEAYPAGAHAAPDPVAPVQVAAPAVESGETSER